MHVYQVPLVPTDLRHEEAMRLSINAINAMKDVVAEVLGKIEARTAMNLARLEKIDSRLEDANRKIEALKDTKKAVIIYSPSQFPETLQDFEPTFQKRVGQQSKFKRVKAEEVKSPMDPTTNRKPQEKLQFYHVRFDEKKAKKKVSPLSPLGVHVPLHLIRSVDSLLVFKRDDKQEKSKASSTASFPIESGRKLDAAPASISNKTHNRQIIDELFYTPGMDTAPELDVPTDLPNLPGIAGDITFSQEDDFMIVPSQSQMNFSIQADAVDTPITSPTPSVTTPSAHSTPTKMSTEPDSTPVVKIECQPIPAPRTIALPTEPKNDYIIPPPPPPPAALNVEPVKTPKVSQDIPQPTDARSNLMAAIRSAGGKTKLRAAADRVPKNEKKKEKVVDKPVGDLMSDLRNRLTMRRKGISGAKDQSTQQPKSPEPTNLMGRISQMIPPPSFNDDDLPKEGGSDEDWN